jgi:hypothetical protein
MGQLLPTREAFRQLHSSETELASEFAEQLSDEWYIIGGQWVTQVDQAPKEIDLVLMHPHYGLHCIEVKASQVKIVKGVWHQLNRAGAEWHTLNRSPISQARSSAFALCDVLRTRSPRLAKLKASFSVALVDTVDLGGETPVEVDRAQLLLEPDRVRLEEWLLDSIAASPHATPLDQHSLEDIQRILLPDLELSFDPRVRLRRQRERVEETSIEQVRALASLDLNDRVVVFGAAGTGKTRLAHLWAREGVRHGENVWLTCYNEPLEGYLVGTTAGRHTPYVRRFLHHIQALWGIDVPPEPAQATARHHYWNDELAPVILKQLRVEHAVWDRIVLDEFQDFNQSWLEILERLIKPGGKILAVADRAQNVYGRDLDWKSLRARWVHAELRRNCRNTRAIAQLLRLFGGAEPATACIEGEPPTFVTPNPLSTLVETVHSALLKHHRGYAPSDTIILVKERQHRQELTDTAVKGTPIRRYASDGSNSYTCETVRRAKGLEAKHAIICDPEGNMSDSELYVAIARAQHHLTVIAPRTVSARLNVTNQRDVSAAP